MEFQTLNNGIKIPVLGLASGKFSTKRNVKKL